MAGTELPTNSSENTPTLNTTIVKIQTYALYMKKNGNAPETIETTIRKLTHLSALCNIDNPEEVKLTIANQNWKNSTKKNISNVYTYYLKSQNKTWTKPKYQIQSQLPFIPTEQEIDSLVSSAGTKTAVLLQILKETGTRIGEIEKLQWTHIDQERRTIYITAEKGSNSRILPISTKLQAMLNNLPKETNKVFLTDKHTQRITFEKLRRRTAKKLNNPRLNQIHFHTFRHYKGTMEYHRTKDIIHVKNILGHKDIESTMIYINLEQALFLEQNDEWTSKAAKTPEECMKLIDAGFTLADTIEGIHIYRKRK